MRILLEAIAAIALLSMYVGVGLNWGNLPERLPTHFNARGIPDKTGPRDSVLLLPIVATGAYLVLTAISRAKVHYNVPFKVDQSNEGVRAELQEMLTAIKAVLAVMMAYLSWKSIAVALGKTDGLGRAFLPAVLVATTAVVIVYLLRLRRFRQ